MTMPPTDDIRTDPGPTASLRRALDALPVERTPPAAAWVGIEQAISMSPRENDTDARAFRSRVNRTTARVALVGMAAALIVVFGLHRSRPAITGRPSTTVALLPDEHRDPRVRAVLDETRNWRVAAADSLRSARWPTAARTAIESALTSTEAALASARDVLRQHPDDAAAREAIATLRSRQLVLLQRAMTLLDEL